MICTPAIRNLIRDNKSYQIQNAMQTGLSKGMHTMDQDLIKLYNEDANYILYGDSRRIIDVSKFPDSLINKIYFLISKFYR